MAGRKHFFNFLALVILAYIVISAEAQCTADGTKCQFSCGKDRLLPSCAVGFAAGVTGGAAGPTYFVTDSSDDADYNNPKPGTIRHALRQASQSPWGLWIKFSYSMEIALTQNLFMASNTTIDGRDAYVTITGWTLVVEGVKNVILHNFAVANVPESDTVHILSGSSLIWVDHISSWNSELGLVSVVQGSTDVTISNCHLSNHNFNMLLGASDGDKIDENMRVTVYRNFFDYSNQRMPHCRYKYTKLSPHSQS
ncbi:probable pectate lyase P56 [Amborella trichopoda]|uniref:Pectate lyase domain-containing protein n=1 Tax=Amborella trichopoda TaxID=13333 RepID=W1P7Q0_AMBTC|nr:probable pectate lyase P56 [Amborella trichopoda]ERN03958.1 hypothetical protein AMTR_s00079p00077550 [Amborella trichopoda]|eukprot:XP_006842283.1 probable pectate lyase P56 [Amborella trichopoda]